MDREHEKPPEVYASGAFCWAARRATCVACRLRAHRVHLRLNKPAAQSRLSGLPPHWIVRYVSEIIYLVVAGRAELWRQMAWSERAMNMPR